MSSLRLGLIGCGRIAELGYLPAVARCEAVELVAVADPTQSRRERLARLAGARACASAAELISDADLDAVVVASPVGEHLEHARVAAEAGLACLVEKPPAGDASAARELAALDPAPWIGFNRRFQQGRELLSLVPARGPLELELELRYRRTSWRAHEVRDIALIDLAPHPIDLALLLGGAPARVHTATCEADRVELELETARGSVTIRCAADRPHLERVIVRRPGGRRLAASIAGGPLRGAAARLRRGPHPLVESLTRQLSAFAVAAAGGEVGLLATAQQGALVMEVVDEASAIAGVGSGPASQATR